MLQKYGMPAFYSLFILLFIGMAVLTLIDADEPETEASFDLELEDAEAVAVNITIPDATLILVGDEGVELMEGEFEYEDEAVHATVNYAVEDELGTLNINQRNSQNVTDVAANTYHIHLAQSVPIALMMTRSAGDSLLDLREMILTSADITLGEGQNRVYLGPIHELLTDFQIDTNGTRRGSDYMVLDCDCPRLERLSVNSNSNSDYIRIDGIYPDLSSLAVDAEDGDDQIFLDGVLETIADMALIAGDGDDRIVVRGAFPSLRRFDIRVGAGSDIVDLSHRWDHHVEIDIISNGGVTVVHLPLDVGVRVLVEPNPDLDVRVTNMTRDESGRYWVNAAYGDEEVILTLNITTSSAERLDIVAGAPDEALIEAPAYPDTDGDEE